MLKVDAVVLQNPQHLPAEAQLTVHHGLLHIDGAEALLAGDAGDGVAADLVVVVGNDHGARCIRTVGVPDVDGDACRPNRENGVLMQHSGAHVGQLPQLLVGNGGDHLRVIDHSGIGDQEAGYIRPVLVNVRLDRPGKDGAGHIGAAPGEGAHMTVSGCPVKARQHHPIHAGKPLPQQGNGFIQLEGAVLVKADYLCRIQEGVSQVICQQHAV